MPNPNTVADFLNTHPTATLDMMTPGGFIVITPELREKLLAGGTLSANPGCPGEEYEREVLAEEILGQVLISLNADPNDPARFYAMTSCQPEHSVEQDRQISMSYQQM